MFAQLAAEAVDIRFEHWGLAASYVPPGGGDAVPCVICRAVPDRMIAFGQGQPVIQSDAVEVRKSELPTPARKGVFTLIDTGETLVVQSDPRSEDQFGLVWQMTVA